MRVKKYNLFLIGDEKIKFERETYHGSVGIRGGGENSCFQDKSCGEFCFGTHFLPNFSKLFLF